MHYLKPLSNHIQAIEKRAENNSIIGASNDVEETPEQITSPIEGCRKLKGCMDRHTPFHSITDAIFCKHPQTSNQIRQKRKL